MSGDPLDDAARDPADEPIRRAVEAFLADLDAVARPERIERLRRAALAVLAHVGRFNSSASAALAIDLARRAVALLDPADDPLVRAQAFDTLGNALYRPASRQMDRAQLAEAKAAFQTALALIDPAQRPTEWIEVANSLAAIPATLHRTDGGAGHRAEADAIYRQARRLAARSRLAAAWATAADNMLRMERDDACAAGDLRALDRALRRMRRVARVRAARAPDAPCADSRHLIARTLAEIADRRYDRALLDEAIALWRRNLDDDPANWARYVNSIGVAEMTIGEKETDDDAFARAAATFLEVADLPSGRGRRPAPLRDGAWTRDGAAEDYLRVLTNLVQVRECLAEATRAAAPLYDNLDDLDDLGDPALQGRSMAGTLLYVRARSEMALWRLTHAPAHRAAAEARAVAAADAFASIPAPAWEALCLTLAAQFLLESAGAPDTEAVFARADVHARRAARGLAAEPQSDPFVAATRLSIEARLAAASWRRDAAAARALGAEIAALLSASWPTPTQRFLLGMAALDAASVAARVEGRLEGFTDLLARLDAFDLKPAGARRRTFEIRRQAARGHALRALGARDAAIDAWERAQALVWEEIVETGAVEASELVELGLGHVGRVLGVGRGFSLADELAAALVERAGPGDAARALAALDRGRAALPHQSRVASPLALALRNEARRLERALDEAQPLGGQGRREESSGDMSRRLNAIRDDLARLAPPQTPALAAVAAALPPRAAVVAVALADAGGALIVLEADGARIASAPAPGLDRASVEALLLGDGASGLLPAIEAMQALPPSAAPRQFHAAANGISAAVDAAQPALAAALMEPLLRLLSPQVDRLCWLVPGAMWPLPLHAIPIPGGRRLAQSFGRTLEEVAAGAAFVRKKAPPTVVVEAIERDGPGPFTGVAAQTLRRPSRKAMLAALRGADVLLFDGHGVHVSGEPDRSGLQLDDARDDPDAFLPMRAILDLEVSGRELAVLSACDAGSIDLSRRIDDFAGTAGELLEAGFATVVAATWPVERRATGELIRQVVDRWTRGRDAAVALAAAQEAALRAPLSAGAVALRAGGDDADGDEPSPATGAYWWAGFRTIGF